MKSVSAELVKNNNFTHYNAIAMLVILENNKTKEEQQILYTLSYEKFSQKMLQLFPKGDETYSIKEIGTNCGIEILNDKKELNVNDLKGKYNLKNITSKDRGLFSSFQILIQTMDAFSTADEIKALTECVTTNYDELMKILVDGKYHFYRYANIVEADFTGEISAIYQDEDIGYEIEEDYFEDEDNSIVENLAKKGYYQASTGILYFPNQIDVDTENGTN